jgi:centromeric protein E
MAAAIPRPSQPSYGPPTTSLPAIPTTKTRKSTGGAIPTIADSKIGLQTPLPKSGLRTPSSTQTPPVTPAPTTALPKLRSTPGVNAAGKTIRKTISINAFPHPPRSGVRTTSLPPSPLSAGVLPTSSSSTNLADQRDSADASPVSGNQKLRRRAKQSISPGNTNYVGNSTPSLLNGSGDSKSISSGAGARGSDGLLSLPSPPQSRSSSAQDSYSTSATNYDDANEGARGRQTSGEAANDRRSSKAPEGKGNVIVSVRVRPDANGNGERSKTDGEWMVDGRRALVAYRGREGGDYYYGR